MEANASKKFERQRIVAILNSVLALCLLVACALMLLFVYSTNEEEPHAAVPDAMVCILMIPLLLNGIQLASGINLLLRTRRQASADHLRSCSRWCFTAKFLTAFVLLEMFILLQFQQRRFKQLATLAFGMFGIQYIVRLVAIQRTRRCMEWMLFRSVIAAGAAARRTPVMLGDNIIATTIVPRNELVYVSGGEGGAATGRTRLTTFGRLATPPTAIHVLPGRPNGGRVLVFDDITGELHLQCQRPDAELERANSPSSRQLQEMEAPPPSYADALSTAAAVGHDKRPPSAPRRCECPWNQQDPLSRFRDAPPSYNEALRVAQARAHWKLVTSNRKAATTVSRSGSGPPAP